MRVRFFQNQASPIQPLQPPAKIALELPPRKMTEPDLLEAIQNICREQLMIGLRLEASSKLFQEEPLALLGINLFKFLHISYEIGRRLMQEGLIHESNFNAQRIRMEIDLNISYASSYQSLVAAYMRLLKYL